MDNCMSDGGNSMKGPKMIEISVTKASPAKPEDRLNIKNKLLEDVKSMAMKAMLKEKKDSQPSDEEEHMDSLEEAMDEGEMPGKEETAISKLPENEGEEESKESLEDLLAQLEDLKSKIKNLVD